MKILFTAEDDDDFNLASFLGFIDVDIELKNLLPDIRVASKDLIKLVGNSIYNLAINYYNQEDEPNESQSEFLYLMRNPIAIDAYRKFSPSNDIAHTNNGRKMRQDDGEKLPFEWMIDRDNKALEKRFYRALDDLLEFLETTDDLTIKNTWFNSANFKKTKQFFVSSVEDFNNVFVIESRLVLHKLHPSFLLFEENEIKSRLTPGIFKKYKDYFQKNTENYPIPTQTDQDDEDENTELETPPLQKSNIEEFVLDESQTEVFVPDNQLIDYIKAAAVNYALAWAMPRLSVQLFPEGVLQYQVSDRTTTQGFKPTLKSETEAARQVFIQDCKSFLALIENHLKTLQEVELTEQQPNNSNNPMPDINRGDNFFNC